MATNRAAGTINHIFVLALENRSFDHMLGFSKISGTDAETGQPIAIGGLTGAESNSDGGVAYPITTPADAVMPVDPSHEFDSVLTQLCGAGATYQPNGAYPPIKCSGFVTSYIASGGGANPGEVMKCFKPDQLPVLTTLAKEFAVCDHWFCSLPGPTWPNRFFLHAASSGGLDHSPTFPEIVLWETLDGFAFENGTIFDRLNGSGHAHAWRIYAGGAFPAVAGLKGINNFQIRNFDNFAGDLAAGYTTLYTFIEPNYGDVVSGSYRGGNSQHPLDDVTKGESLIKETYEAIRNSPIWPDSLLMVTWDEHGGFYDHVAPPAAVPPGDNVVTGGVTSFGFNFTQYGPRVPAIVVSPLIPRNVIDHRLYDHVSVPATIEAVFGLDSLTRRDGEANNITSLASLAAARTDAPTVLPAPSALEAPMFAAVAAPSPPPSTDPIAHPIDMGNLAGFLHAALRSELARAKPEDRQAILRRFAAIKTRADAKAYLDNLRPEVHARRAANAE